jgi:biopolymer transport protein ExbB/TolQ
MKPYLEWFAQGGLPIMAILALSVVLYTRCFKLLLRLAAMRRELVRRAGPTGADALQREREEAQQLFARHRISLGAMIAAAPLLGLLGTVSGMAQTFEHLGGSAGGKSMEGLARGISEVLVATEAGLSVAIPAMVLVFVAHRQMRAHVELVNHQLRGTRGT